MKGMTILGLLLTLVLSLLLSVNASAADRLYMTRSAQAFPETMSSLQEHIRDLGYTVSRVQHVDVGLTAMGYKTDLYRVVFYGKVDEVHELVGRHPEIAPYLPMKVAIFAENGETLLVASDPRDLLAFVKGEEMKALLERWASDLEILFDRVRNSE